jgi:hypothetical protein
MMIPRPLSSPTSFPWRGHGKLVYQGALIGFDEAGQPIYLSDSQRKLHTYILGVSGSGKTMMVSCIVAQDLLRGAGVVYFDMIGTGVPYVRRVLAHANLSAMARERTPYPALNQRLRREREAFFGRISIIEFGETSETGEEYRFNPFEPTPELSTAELAGDFAKCIERMQDGKLSEMRSLALNITSIAAILIETGEATVADMVAFCLADPETLQGYLRDLQRLRAEGKLHVPVREDLAFRYLSGFFAMTSGRERRELMASTLRVIALLLNDPVTSRFLSSIRGNLPLGEIASGRRSGLMGLQPGTPHRQIGIGNMVMGRLVALAMRRRSEDVQSGKVPLIHLVGDEIQRIWSNEFPSDIAVLRNKGVAVMIAHQSGNQPPFHTLEGRAALESVRDNCSTHIILRAGLKDAQELAPELFQPRGEMIRRQTLEVTRSAGTSSASSRTHSSARNQTRSKTSGRSANATQSVSAGQTASVTKTTGAQRTRTLGSSRSHTQGQTLGDSVSDGWSQSQGHTTSRSSARGLAIGEATSESQSQSQSEGTNWSAHQGTGMVQGMRHEELGNALALTNLSHADSSGHGEGGSIQRGSSSATGLSRSRASSHTEGSAQGDSSSQSRSGTQGRSRSVSQSQGSSDSESRAEGQTQSQSRGDSRSRSVGHSVGHAMSQGEGQAEGWTQGQAKAETQGASQSMSEREVIEYYSVEEETTIRAYEVMDAPNRTAFVLSRGNGPAVRMRTPDMPLEPVTALGRLDGLVDLNRLTTPAPVLEEPVSSLFERIKALRMARAALGKEGGS